MRRSSIRPIVAGLALLSCVDDRPGPTAPATPTLAISDAVHSAGNEHFYLLPPLVPNPDPTGTFDPALEPVVEVCEWDAVCGTVVARFTMATGTGSNLIRVDAEAQHYLVNWDTKTCESGACTLNPTGTYRLRVLVATVELGYADVDVVANGSQLKNVQTDEYIGLVNGRTLPVKFRIEEGAINVLPPTGGGAPILPADGGTLATADGGVVMEIPPDALPASGTPTTITIAPAEPSALPESPTVVPNLVYDFGPDGTQFETPVTVRIAYDPATLPVGLIEEHLRLFTVVDGAWQLVPRSRVDLAANVIVGEVTHFSPYGGGSAIPVARLYAYPFHQADMGCSGALDYFLTHPGQVFRLDRTRGGSWWQPTGTYYFTLLMDGTDGNAIDDPREVQVLSSNPGIVNVDELDRFLDGNVCLPFSLSAVDQGYEDPHQGWDGGVGQVVNNNVHIFRAELLAPGPAYLYLTSEAAADTVPISVVGPTVHWNIVASPTPASQVFPYREQNVLSEHFLCSGSSDPLTLQVGQTLTVMVEGCDEFGNFTGEAHFVRAFLFDGGWTLESDCGGVSCDPGVVSVLEPPWWGGAPFATVVAVAPGHARLAYWCGGIVCTDPAPVDVYVLPPP